MNTVRKLFKKFDLKFPSLLPSLHQHIFIEGLFGARYLGYMSEQKRQKFCPCGAYILVTCFLYVTTCEMFPLK